MPSRRPRGAGQEHTRAVSEVRRRELGQIRRAASLVELRMRLARGAPRAPHGADGRRSPSRRARSRVRKALPLVLSNRRAWEILARRGGRSRSSRSPPRCCGASRRARGRWRSTATTGSPIGSPTRSRSTTREGDASPLMEVAIDDACEHAGGLVAAQGRADPAARAICSARRRSPRASRRSRCCTCPPRPPVVVPQEKTIDAVAMQPRRRRALPRRRRSSSSRQGSEPRGEGGDREVQPAHRGHRQQAPRSHRGVPPHGGRSSASSSTGARPTRRRSRRRSRRCARS